MDDILIGNAVDNVLSGGAGNDMLVGLAEGLVGSAFDEQQRLRHRR